VYCAAADNWHFRRMKYPVTRFRSLKLALKELEPFVRNGQHLATGRPFKRFGGMRSREALANWLLCAVVNSTEEIERVTFSSDPIGGDGIIYDDVSGFAFRTEHVYVPRADETAVGNIETLILERIEQKRAKGGAPYASGKTLIVFLDSGGGSWYPDKVAKQMPEPVHFDAIWVVGLREVTAGKYVYAVTRVDELVFGITPKWLVRLAGDFQSWTVELFDGH
jgi:hypothetical protein